MGLLIFASGFSIHSKSKLAFHGPRSTESRLFPGLYMDALLRLAFLHSEPSYGIHFLKSLSLVLFVPEYSLSSKDPHGATYPLGSRGPEMDGLRAYIDNMVQGKDDADGSAKILMLISLPCYFFSLSDKRPPVSE